MATYAAKGTEPPYTVTAQDRGDYFHFTHIHAPANTPPTIMDRDAFLDTYELPPESLVQP